MFKLNTFYKTIAIVGPTASGKSRLAHYLAKQMQTQIISADSRLVYKKMDIGTAKPTPEERQELPYHLIDVVEPKQNYSLADYIETANPVMQKLHSEGKVPIVVGGTGFYLRGLLENLPLTSTGPDELFRDKIKNITTEDLYAQLKTLDKTNKWQMHFNDRPRIIRALEIEKATDQLPVKSLNAQQNYNESTLWIGLNFDDRSKLREKINLRVKQMLAEGLLEECQNLLSEYGHLELFDKTIGYAEALKFLKGEIKTQDELINLITISTSQYSKRQMTWFRANKKIHWLNAQSSVEEQLQEVKTLYQENNLNQSVE